MLRAVNSPVMISSFSNGNRKTEANQAIDNRSDIAGRGGDGCATPSRGAESYLYLR